MAVRLATPDLRVSPASVNHGIFKTASQDPVAPYELLVETEVNTSPSSR